MSATRRAWRQAAPKNSGVTSPWFVLMLALILYLLLLYTWEWTLACIGSTSERLGFSAAPWMWLIRLLAAAAIHLPLGMAIYRLAVLLAVSPSAGEEGIAALLAECLYPFTSLSAYGTCLLTGLETAAWAVLAVLPPVMLLQAAGSGLRVLLTMPAIGYGLFVLWLSGLRAGYAGAALAAGRPLRGWRRRRGLADTFLLRLRMLGCCLLCALGVLVPLLFYGVPRCLLAGAVWAVGPEEAHAEEGGTDPINQ